MRTPRLFILSFLLLLSASAVAQFKTAAVGVDGLTCSMCCYGVEKSVSKLKFVQKVKVDLNTNEASIEFKQNEAVDIKRLVRSIADAGFSVRSLSVIFDTSKLASNTAGYFLSDNATFIILDSSALDQKGKVTLNFVEKDFSNRDLYNKYKTEIDQTLSKAALKDSYYFVTL